MIRWIHRYLGIALGPMFVVWFASGIAMMYARGMPGLTPEARLQHLPPVDLARVGMTPAEAVARGGFDIDFNRVVLLTVMDRPAYRFTGGEPATIFADTGDRLVALAGILLGIIQYIRSSVPYSGWMRWHYRTGILFGIFTFTWVFSGMLSMLDWASGGKTGDGIPQALSGGPVNLSAFRAMDADAWKRLLEQRAPKEIAFVRIQGNPYYL